MVLDASELNKMRHDREVRRIEITWADGELHVEVTEYARPTRQPCLPLDLPLMPRPVVALPAPRATEQMALGF